MAWSATFFAALFLASSGQEAPREEPRLGTRIPSPIEEESAVDAPRREGFMVVQKVGACVAKSEAELGMALVIATPGTSSARSAVASLQPALSECLLVASQGTDLFGKLTLRFNEPLLRGAVAEGLYRRQFANRPFSASHTNVPVSPILPQDRANPNYAGLVIPYAFAQCVTQANPAAVRTIILSKMVSREERAGFSALEPVMSPCLTKGTTFKTQRDTFRFMLAEALYRWSIATNQASSQGYTR